MLRRGTWAIVAGVVVGSASLTAAASPSLRSPAQVADRAQRLNPSFEPERTPEERAIVELVELVNLERAALGLQRLRLDDRATGAARAHAAEMASTGTMQHAGLDGSDGGVRLTRAGFNWVAWGENLGAGFVAPDTLVSVWMGSAFHRDNLLGPFTEIGVGVVATADGVPYWSVLVARSPY